jgi:hypothetical protein
MPPFIMPVNYVCGCGVGRGAAGTKLMKLIYEKTGCQVAAYSLSTAAGVDNGLSGSAWNWGPFDSLIGHEPGDYYPGDHLAY